MILGLTISASELYHFFLDNSVTEPLKLLGRFLPTFQYDTPVKINSSVVTGFKMLSER